MIEVGEYVRTKDGLIGKYENRKEGYFECVVTDTFIGLEEEIIKHSSNIIDLIEEGDYVNGHEVITVYGYDENGNDKDELGICEVDGDDACYLYLENEDIKSIVTKEQFSSVEYRLE